MYLVNEIVAIVAFWNLRYINALSLPRINFRYITKYQNRRNEEFDLCGDDPEEYNPGATLWKGSILEPNLISSGEDNNNSDLEITKVWKIIIIYILLCCGPLNLHSELSFR